MLELQTPSSEVTPSEPEQQKAVIKLPDYGSTTVQLSEQQVAVLKKLAKPLSELKNDGVFIYPPLNDDLDSDDEAEEGNGTSGKDRLIQLSCQGDGRWKIKADKFVGFMSYKGVHLEIRSRFAKSADKDFFLHYLISKMHQLPAVNLPMTVSEQERVLDLLPLLFPSYLTKAVSQGLFKQYQRRHYNDSRPKGTIAVARHLKVNVPFQGKVAYDTRELTYDNPVTQLVRHTIEVLRSKQKFSYLLTSSPEVATAVRQIELATPSFARARLAEVVTANHRPCSHPLLTEYQPLQQLCLKILRNEALRFEQADDTIHGVVFNIASIWEEYLATLLEPKGFEHPNNRTGSGRIYLAQAKYCNKEVKKFPMFPDFYHPTSDELSADLVLDAKYKRYESGEPKKDDVLQMVRYMFALTASKAVLLCPSQKSQPNLSHFDLRGYGGTIDVKFLSIPQEELTFKNFALRMVDAERQLLDELAKL